MRIEVALSIGVGVALIGVVLSLIGRRRSQRELGSVSGQWIAEQTRSDSDPQ